MNKKVILSVVALSSVLMAGCQNTTEVKKPVAETKVAVTVEKVNPLQSVAQVALKEAKYANEVVRKKGFEWNVTKKLLKKADKSMKAGEFEAVIKMAATAKSYALIGLEQAETAKTAGPRLLK